MSTSCLYVLPYSKYLNDTSDPTEKYLTWLFRSALKQIKTSIFSISLLKTPSKVDGLVFLLHCTSFASMVHVLTHFSDPSCGLLILLPATCFVSFHPSSKACSIVTYIIKLSIAVSSFPLTAHLHFLLLIFLTAFITMSYYSIWGYSIGKGLSNIQGTWDQLLKP